jgi:transcriptional regulator with XRE-family HTH domain
LNKIKLYRSRLGFTQHELARRAGVSPTTVYMAERGEGKLQAKTLHALAGALGVSVEDLLAEEAVLPKVDAPVSEERALSNGDSVPEQGTHSRRTASSHVERITSSSSAKEVRVSIAALEDALQHVAEGDWTPEKAREELLAGVT